ncbi:MAG: transposase [Planctomycetes bacterium]|nr:transposase [Planctomycetota bacterium]
MSSIPKAAEPLLQEFLVAFTRPTHRRFVVLLLGAILTTGRRTVTNILRTVSTLAPGHPSSYHRVLSRRRWSSWRLARTLAGFILDRWVPEGPVYVCGDDTVDEHRGKEVYGKACHRDAVRSTHSFTAYRWGHKWVVLTLLVKFPFATRLWALPVLVALYRSKEWNRKHGRPHKTPSELMRQLLAALIRWFPRRKFVFAGDGGYGTHELARFGYRHRDRLTLVSRFYPDANLYAPPPKVRSKKNGRPRTKGRKLASPQEGVKKAPRTRLTVAWYGGGTRRIEVVSGTGHWYKTGEGLVPVRWVFVHDLTGTHRDEYFFTTDGQMTPKQIVETFTGRWSIETTFQEMRAYLGLETTRGWIENTVLRAAPSLFGLFSVIVLLYAEIPANPWREPAIFWPGKRERTFSDAITTVRRWLWTHWVFATPQHHEAFSKLSRPFKALLLYALAPAA